MARERVIFFAVIAVAVLVVATLLLWPRVQEKLDPKPLQAWVALEVPGDGVPRVGRVELDAGQPFRLHAVLEARDRHGETLYYTEAPALEIAGERIPPQRLRHWDRGETVRVLWFAVEGATPYLPLDEPDAEPSLEFEELFRADWPRAWSIPGQRERPFGLQRFHVRIEMSATETAMVPEERFKSWGAAELPQRWEDFPTAVVRLAGPLGPASSVFGLTQVEPPPQPAQPLLLSLAELYRRRLAFSRLLVLRDAVAAAGLRFDQLTWREIPLQGSGLAWGSGVAGGDLLRVGSRVVVLYRDAEGGAGGTLDPADLCFDYERGAVVVPLSEVFVGEGLVEHASLAG
ncbi:MAG TPA: hypothetical protein VMT16_00100 [Thermoanaerobaculia bacterium]|nr:hypothetical protein [Thermoanaerobaculia bacterium]